MQWCIMKQSNKKYSPDGSATNLVVETACESILLRRYFLAGVLHCQRMRASLCYGLQREHS
jgi:hypothetical protein